MERLRPHAGMRLPRGREASSHGAVIPLHHPIPRMTRTSSLPKRSPPGRGRTSAVRRLQLLRRISSNAGVGRLGLAENFLATTGQHGMLAFRQTYRGVIILSRRG